MQTLSATGYPTSREHGARRRRGLQAVARQVAVDLTPQAVEQVAARVAQLIDRQHRAHDQERAEDNVGLLTVAKLAKYLDLNPAYVYEHADDLGAIRIGDGPKARIRFDLHTANAALTKLQATREPGPRETAGRQRRRPATTGAHSSDPPLLEIKRREIKGLRSYMPPRQCRALV